jgi:hypothetical protein
VKLLGGGAEVGMALPTSVVLPFAGSIPLWIGLGLGLDDCMANLVLRAPAPTSPLQCCAIGVHQPCRVGRLRSGREIEAEDLWARVNGDQLTIYGCTQIFLFNLSFWMHVFGHAHDYVECLVQYVSKRNPEFRIMKWDRMVEQ